jgi:hypothetical protein
MDLTVRYWHLDIYFQEHNSDAGTVTMTSTLFIRMVIVLCSPKNFRRTSSLVPPLTSSSGNRAFLSKLNLLLLRLLLRASKKLTFPSKRASLSPVNISYCSNNRCTATCRLAPVPSHQLVFSVWCSLAVRRLSWHCAACPLLLFGTTNLRGALRRSQNKMM